MHLQVGSTVGNLGRPITERYAGVVADRCRRQSSDHDGPALSVVRLRAIGVSICLALLTGLAGGCSAAGGDGLLMTKNVILWHSWPEAQAMVLDRVLGQISEINPNVGVISLYVPPEELSDHYVEATYQGVGPDLLLGSSEWIRELVEAETVRPIDPIELERFSYYENAVSALEYDSAVYGFPLSLYPMALYYNRSQTTSPPTTLEALLEQAEAGSSVALVPRFRLAYWGIQPFGHGLFDVQGRFTLDGSGFTEWLTWLNKVQHEPGIILNTDDMALEEMFVTGKVTYYVNDPAELPDLELRMPSEQIGVTPLPSGPDGPSGPLLPLEAVMLSTASSEEQSVIALAVAHYLTNPQQSTTFMRDLGQIPANRDVKVDPRIYPNLYGFHSQSRTAVSLPNQLNREAFYAAGDRAYANTLSGVLTPAEAVCAFGREVIAIQGYAPEQIDMPADCGED